VTTLGLDYSWGRPGGEAVAAAGYEFVIRYLPYPGHHGKGLSRPEITDIREHGLDLGVIYESVASRALHGHGAGSADARQSVRSMEALGIPEIPVYFAVDFDAQPHQYAQVAQYFAGCASVLGSARVGLYGSYSVVQAFSQDDPSTSWYWQTYAWSRGRLSPFAHVYQYRNGQIVGGAEVDFNREIVPDWGQWKAEEDMTQEEFEAMLVVAMEKEPVRDSVIDVLRARGYKITTERFNEVDQDRNIIEAIAKDPDAEIVAQIATVVRDALEARTLSAPWSVAAIGEEPE
jgi:hypothetical protein